LIGYSPLRSGDKGFQVNQTRTESTSSRQQISSNRGKTDAMAVIYNHPSVHRKLFSLAFKLETLASLIPTSSLISCKNDLPLTVDHLFDCALLTSIRGSYHVPHNLMTALTDHSTSLSNVFSYLRHTNFLSRI